MYDYKTRGTCSSAIHFDVENDVITQCAFDRGCTGNTQALSRLVVGMPVQEAITRLKGIQCQNGTSCPDQLARALESWQAQQKK